MSNEAQVQPLPASVSIIDNVNLSQVHQTMQKIYQFQATVQKTLKKGHDYGEIPGVGSKPTLLKPGAEKILMLLGLTSEYELIERVQDYDNGFFAFTVKCTICRNGIKITEGLGHANTRERRYASGRQQDPYTLANTVLKMAKKRAQIDAVLTVASLSEIFTQDLEDLTDELSHDQYSQPKQQQYKNNASSNELATNAQRNKIYAMAREYNLSNDEMKQIMLERYGVDDSRKLKKKDATDLIDYIPEYVATRMQNGEAIELDPNEFEAVDYKDINDVFK